MAVLATLSACTAPVQVHAGHHSSTCTPPAGGRCAADVAWPGHIFVSPNGRVLHGVILCGGSVKVVSETPSRVTLRLHVGAMGPGSMTCARVDVGADLADPLGHRSVYDAVTGRRLVVVGGS